MRFLRAALNTPTCTGWARLFVFLPGTLPVSAEKVSTSDIQSYRIIKATKASGPSMPTEPPEQPTTLPGSPLASAEHVSTLFLALTLAPGPHSATLTLELLPLGRPHRAESTLSTKDA